MKKTIVLATTNAGKVRELAGGLSAYGLEVVGLDEFPQVGDIEETGKTFEENALLKAKTVAEAVGLIAIADDSGLEVDALDGAPGIYSARYGADLEFLADESKDARNIRKLLMALEGETNRLARFVCCMAVCMPNGEQFSVRGTWEGTITNEPRGEQGFGYDPVFFDAILGRTAAELSKDEKNARSHRGKALAQLLAQWDKFYQGG